MVRKMKISARSAVAALAVVAPMAVVAAPASAEPLNFYARLDVGASLGERLDGNYAVDQSGFDSRPHSSAVIGGGVGVGLPWFGLRSDVRVEYRPSLDLKTNETVDGGVVTSRGGANSLTALANIYKDFDLGLFFSPYVGAGLGIARNEVRPITSSFSGLALGTEKGKTKTDFAWALMAGATVPIAQPISLDFGYRYLDAGSFESGGVDTLGNKLTPVKGDFHSHELTLGVRYSF